MTSSPTIKWVALALVGLLIAAAVAVLGSSLASRQIGLSSEPLRAGDALGPPAISHPETKKPAAGNGPAPKPQPANPEGPSNPAAPPEPVAPPTEPAAPSEPPEPAGDHPDGEGGDD